MQFNSYLFIMLFLPVFVLGYFIFNRKNILAGKIYVIIAGIIFYMYGGWDIAVVLGISIAINLMFALIIRGGKRNKSIFCSAAILLNIILLFFYKYFNFVVTNTNAIFNKKFNEIELALPIGISFFTFQQIMYIVAIYRDEIEKVDVVDYLSYILYFPKLVMGPLIEAKDLINQLNNTKLKRVNWDNIASGLKLFSFGLFKKMVLADTFSRGVSWGFANIEAATAGDFWLVMLFYTFEIYFDFSGYTDMAVGISTMINISLPINFDSPYKAFSIRDFWKRWHISLTNFFTKYIYFPLGGSKKGKFRTYINIMMVFLLSGFWHGANWTFVLWGCIHGILQIAERIFKSIYDKLFEVVKWGYTFLAVNLLWLLFRSETIVQWSQLLVVRIGNPCAYFRSISPIAQVKKPRRSTTTSAFFDLHSRKNILRNMHKDFRYGLLVKMFTFSDMAISDGLKNSLAIPESTFLFDILKLTELNARYEDSAC